MAEQKDKCPECKGSGTKPDYLSKVCVVCEYKGVDGGGQFMCCCFTGCPHADEIDCPTCKEEKKLDSPREKIARWLYHFRVGENVNWEDCPLQYYYLEKADQIIALIEPLIKDAREQEKKEWVELLLAYDHPILNKRSNCLIPSGEWQALKEE